MPRSLDYGTRDAFLLAGRYTPLEQTALDGLLPACSQAGTSIVCTRPFNSGILAGGTTWNYKGAPAEIVGKAAALRDVAAAFGTSLPAMALQFPLAHPAVTCVPPGPRTARQLARLSERTRAQISPEAWAALRERELPHPGTPVPDHNPYETLRDARHGERHRRCHINRRGRRERRWPAVSGRAARGLTRGTVRAGGEGSAAMCGWDEKRSRATIFRTSIVSAQNGCFA